MSTCGSLHSAVTGRLQLFVVCFFGPCMFGGVVVFYNTACLAFTYMMICMCM